MKVRRGQSTTELAIVLVAVVIVAIVILTTLGGKVGELYNCVVHDLQHQNCTVSVPAPGASPGAGYAASVQSDSPSGYWRLDDSGASITDAVGAHNGTLTGTATEGIGGALAGGGDKAIVFDGSSGYVSAPLPAVGAAWSIEVWVKTSSTSPGELVEQAPVTFSEIAGGNLQVAVTGVGSVTTLLPSPGIADGNWHYVVVSDDGSTVDIYIDDTLRSTSTTLGGSATLTGASLYMARAGAGGNFFAGGLDEVAVYSKALGSDRVLSHWLASGA